MKSKIDFSFFKKRHAITDFEKKILRVYYFDSVNKKSVHKIFRDWFREKFQHLFFQSTISELLSAKFAHLNIDLCYDYVLQINYTIWFRESLNVIEWIS